MFELDMCLCASENCDRYNDCYRGTGVKRQGVYTQSLLAVICNKDNNYEFFIEREE